ncbi:PSP, proline-rich [Corchorus olitorius]|uniref:PSP, proline-rich n=1 Tax=Corchorus olitorius TaxID=93759 RepID=A0A1R3H5V1_9ROSI|nr:PSP, proline-rich [Corchorus olitorius]
MKAERRRRRRKQKKNKYSSQQQLNDAANGTVSEAGDSGAGEDEKKENSDHQQVAEQVIIVEYVAELDDGIDEEFKKIFEKFSFAVSEEETGKKDEFADAKKKADSDSEEDYQQKEKGTSNKKKKKRMKNGELKKICSRPDVVEAWDATAADPKLLVLFKAYRNTVPVPRHWCQKRKYLEGKRGIEKKPFQLPDFIAATGIAKIRQAYIEKEDSKKLKQKQRERMQPKMGKMDIDYQLLHDAFFKYQTKTKLTSYGDLYYEGKEFEVKMKPVGSLSSLSHELKEALGMAELGGPAPPPWLINMQRYGPPPSYPHLKIAGLNAPIPPGASFGNHPGGWGKPPVDESGRPLYGDVFGVQQPNYEEEPPVDKSKHWGDLVEAEEEEIEEDGIQSVSSTPTGDEAPDVIDLRKQKRKEPERSLYQVLEEKEDKIAPGTLLGTTHTYVVNTDKSAAKRVEKTDRVEVSLQPEELQVMDNVLPAKYEEAREEEQLRSQHEDFSDMVAENEKKRKRKMQEKEGKSKKKKKDFKF